MEIRLLVHACGLPDASERDLAALKAAYDRLPEGFTTTLVSRARELIEKGQVPAPDPSLRPVTRAD